MNNNTSRIDYTTHSNVHISELFARFYENTKEGKRSYFPLEK